MMIGRQLGEPTPEQFEALEHQNAAVIQHQEARAKVPPAAVLQNALKALGVAMGDSKLSKLRVDGIIGPGTAKAATYAFATYLNAPNTMSAAYVRQHITYLTNQIVGYVQEHGGVVLPPPVGSQRNLSIISPLPPIPTSPITPASGSGFFPNLSSIDPKYIWYGVAGFSALLILSMAATAIRGRRKAGAGAEA
jgi:hypothetical protein